MCLDRQNIQLNPMIWNPLIPRFKTLKGGKIRGLGSNLDPLKNGHFSIFLMVKGTIENLWFWQKIGFLGDFKGQKDYKIEYNVH